MRSNTTGGVKKETTSDNKTEFTREVTHSFRTANLIQPLLASVIEGSIGETEIKKSQSEILTKGRTA